MQVRQQVEGPRGEYFCIPVPARASDLNAIAPHGRAPLRTAAVTFYPRQAGKGGVRRQAIRRSAFFARPAKNAEFSPGGRDVPGCALSRLLSCRRAQG